MNEDTSLDEDEAFERLVGTFPGSTVGDWEPEVERPPNIRPPVERCSECKRNIPKNGISGLCRGCAGEEFPGGSLVPEIRQPFADQVFTTVNNPQPGLQALSRTDAWERINKTPATWVVEGIIRSTDYGCLVGPKGAGKTLAELDMAVSVALGEPWFGRFPTTPGKVLVLTCEDSEGQTWQRLDAIARSKGRDPDELEGWVYVHPIPFSVLTDLEKLRVELGTFEDIALVVLDPAYKYMAGANTRAIFDMGAVLTPLQVVCQERGAALVVGHHYNRREGAAREERVSGAGLHEWGRYLITVEERGNPTDDDVRTVRLEITGNSMPDVGLTLRRAVVPLDDSPNPELSYYVEVVSEGLEDVGQPWTAERRVLALLPTDPAYGLRVAEVQEATMNDESGLSPLKMDTVGRTLRRLREDTKADTDSQVGSAGRWWRT